MLCMGTRLHRLLLASAANGEIRRAAKRAENNKGHRHHEQDAIEVARSHCLRAGVVPRQTVLAGGTRGCRRA